ncbi:hypothetical protein H4Q26_011160 [Puccinia striiformis f. sp. tritici PST-130]|nr:hypothetical protein H4Q26_011160 [Puccinia striiformis f. sp. tritici PST-130]
MSSSISFKPDNAVPATSAKGFDGRERSEESRYAREKEVAELKELLAKQNAKIEELEKNVIIDRQVGDINLDMIKHREERKIPHDHKFLRRLP